MTPAEIAQKQVQNTTAAVPAMIRGVDRVDESPTAKAAKNLDKAQMNYAKAVQDGSMANALNAVSTEEWKEKTKAKADRVATGVQESADTIQKFHEQRGQFQEGIDSKLNQMPTKTPQDMDNRMLTQVREMRKFRFRKRG